MVFACARFFYYSAFFGATMDRGDRGRSTLCLRADERAIQEGGCHGTVCKGWDHSRARGLRDGEACGGGWTADRHFQSGWEVLGDRGYVPPSRWTAVGGHAGRG